MNGLFSIFVKLVIFIFYLGACNYKMAAKRCNVYGKSVGDII